jgi:hypothetical protein
VQLEAVYLEALLYINLHIGKIISILDQCVSLTVYVAAMKFSTTYNEMMLELDHDKVLALINKAYLVTSREIILI